MMTPLTTHRTPDMPLMVCPPSVPLSTSAITRAHAKGAVVTPRVGGSIIDGTSIEPWCGGSNLFEVVFPEHFVRPQSLIVPQYAIMCCIMQSIMIPLRKNLL